ncbi:hypothetical protein V6N13_003114 [Hibiscus sabdariffa]|uniref:Uncharacterized protein n=1 Tax=Hibiscus sabdariffa TaxID=183260 RepID=A0ABR2NE40_9ROSI
MGKDLALSFSLKAFMEACILSCRNSELLILNNEKGYRVGNMYVVMSESIVGESFRNLNKEDKTICQSPILRTSSSTKLGSVSAVTVDSFPNIGSNQVEDLECKSFKSCTEDPIDALNTSCSNKSEYSLDIALKLLLDFPVGMIFVLPLFLLTLILI